MKAPITVEGNLAADPEMGTTKEGKPYAQMLLIVDDERFNAETQEWEKAGESVLHNVTVFGHQADNVERSLHKGDRAVVSGDLQFKVWDSDGQRRQGTQIVARSIGPSLRYDTATVNRSPKAPSPDAAASEMVAYPGTASGIADVTR